MSLESARSAVSTTFQSEFGAAYPTTPISWENVRFTQPENKAWVHFAFVMGDSVRQEAGNTKNYRHFGVINVTILVPQDTGTKLSTEMVDKVFNILADRDWSTAEGALTTYGAQKISRGNVNGWYTRNVLLEYRYDTSIERG